MGRSSTTRPGSGRRLFAAYVVASAVPVAVLGAGLAHGIQHDGVAHGLEHGRAQAAVIEEMAIAPALRGEDLAGGLTGQEQQRLSSATDLAIFSGSVVRLRLRSFDGDVVFSDDGAVDGALPATQPAFVAAAAGGTDVAVLGDGPQRSIRVLQPVVPTASGRSVGVLELHLPYETVATYVREATTRTYWRLAVGLGLLHVVLAAVSWSTTRSLRRHAARREREALHDPLTGLPNRELYRQRLEEVTDRRATCAVVLVDLDRFKEVNDTLGHSAGDALLQVVAQRLTTALRPGDTVARLGGDEFGLLLPGLADPGEVSRLLAGVRRDLAADTVLDGVALRIEASFGAAVVPRDAVDASSALRCADAAMYHGKRGTAGIVVYDPATVAAPEQHLTVQRDVRQAIENDELVLHYQPVVDLASGDVTHLEALVRWERPGLGLLPPADFLPAVERSGLIDPLTEWVLRQALSDCARWVALGHDWGVAVNVSVRNLEGAGFPATVERLLSESGVPASRLRLEVTETALAVDAHAAASAIGALAERGVGLALDDFGVGYASLSHLRSLALTEVKIDRGFVAGVEGCEADRRVVGSLIQLAHGLGLAVTAEGVETPSARDWLLGAGCDAAQGYHFARPAPWQDVAGRADRDRRVVDVQGVPA